MERTNDLLQRMGLTKYETLAYISLVSKNIDTASQLSKDSGVPRTKIYSTLESLAEKGWVKIISGWPLLFKPIFPKKVLESKKKEFDSIFGELERRIKEEKDMMSDKFVISRRNVGLETLQKVLEASKTVYISNATRELYDELRPAFRDDVMLHVIMFPGEVPPKDPNVDIKVGAIKIVNLFDKVEVPAANVLIDEERSFTLLKNPYTKRWEVDEMVFEDCISCFRGFWDLGWENSIAPPRKEKGSKAKRGKAKRGKGKKSKRKN